MPSWPHALFFEGGGRNEKIWNINLDSLYSQPGHVAGAGCVARGGAGRGGGRVGGLGVGRLGAGGVEGGGALRGVVG